jgi:hypothetical protein
VTASTAELSPQCLITDCPLLPLAAGVKALEGTIACIDTASGTVKPAVSGNATLLPIGRFENTVDNTANTGAGQVLVRLRNEIRIEYFANDTVAPISSLLATAYLLDNQTVTAAATGNALAGRVWDIDPAKGIGVVFPAF